MLGKTVKGKIIRLVGLGYLLFLDFQSPGYLKFQNPLEPLVSLAPIESFLKCPQNRIASLPPNIPIADSLSSKKETVAGISRKLGSPVCKKDGHFYWKIKAAGLVYYLKVNVGNEGQIKGYEFFQE